MSRSLTPALLALVAVLALALAVTACGDDDWTPGQGGGGSADTGATTSPVS